MTAYTITRTIDATQTLTVDIDDGNLTKEQIARAVEEAADAHPDSGVTLCYQCADQVELGDVQNTVVIYRDDKEFWDDRGGFQ